MRPIILIILTILLLVFPAQGYAYYKWYDENGSVHYTEVDPPPDAKNEDGSNWWEDEPESEQEDLDRKKKSSRRA
jgi:hypothetical protein